MSAARKGGVRASPPPPPPPPCMKPKIRSLGIVDTVTTRSFLHISGNGGVILSYEQASLSRA